MQSMLLYVHSRVKGKVCLSSKENKEDLLGDEILGVG